MPLKGGSPCEIKERDLQAMFELQIQQGMTLAWLQRMLGILNQVIQFNFFVVPQL